MIPTNPYGTYQPYNPYAAMMPQPQPRMQAQEPYQPTVQPATGFIKCRAVTSIDEAKAALIDVDGSLHVFTDIGNNCIYTKQINLDGTATIKTYRLDAPQEAQKSPETNESTKVDLSSYVQQKDLENVCQAFNMQIDSLENRLKGYDMALQQLSDKQNGKGGGKK